MDTLTKEQIQGMPAGEEMDALIGLLLGYTRHQGHPGRWITPDGLLSLGVGGLPAFSTDIADAKQLQAVQFAQEWNFEIYHGHAGAGQPPFLVIQSRYDFPNRSDIRHYATAETEALAICRAALLATPVSSAPAVLATV